MNRRELLIGATALASGACAPANGQAQAPGFPIRRAVNMGNALEANYEGEWGYTIEEDHLTAIADAGFDGIRLPVKWSAFAERNPGYRIDPAMLARVDEIIDQCFARQLKVQLDIHHFGQMMEDPRAAAPRVAELWTQLAEHYAARPPELIFELMNELNGGYWNAARTTALYQESVAAIRYSNPNRLIVVGPPDWNSINGLNGWTLPQDDHLALTVHYYGPHELTHQDGEWLSDPPNLGREWGTDSDVAEVRRHIAIAADWASTHNIGLQLGEFGVNRRVPVAQRALWTRVVREACDAHAVGWAVWDFAGTFEIFNRERGAFIPELRDALLSQ
jgi:endoglucanase